MRQSAGRTVTQAFEQVVNENADRYLVVMEDLCRFVTAKDGADG